MLWEYIKEVAGASWEFATGGGELIEFLIFGLVFFIPKYLAKHEELKDERGTSVGRMLWSKFLTEDGWRFFVVVALCFICHCLIIAPYKVYKEARDKVENYTNMVADLKTKSDVVQSQSATLASYQVENAKLNRQITDFEFERDRSTEAIKKRAIALANQMFDFLYHWNTNSPPTQTAEERQAWITNDMKVFDDAFMKSADARRAFSEMESLQFAKLFVGRLTSLQGQLADLEVKTPQLDYLIATDSRMYFEIMRAAEELKSVSENLPVDEMGKSHRNTMF